jgi:hypothetical protein
METRRLTIENRSYEIAVIRDGDVEVALITRDGIAIHRVSFPPDPDIRLSLLDTLESDVRQGIIR